MVKLRTIFLYNMNISDYDDQILLIEGCNFNDFPVGGQLTFCRYLLKCFPEYKFKLVGITTDKKDDIGQWQNKMIEGKYYRFFPLYYVEPRNIKPRIPARLKIFISILKYKNKIMPQRNIPYRVITNAPETILAISLLRRKSYVLHIFHGLDNPISKSRYKIFRCLGNIFWVIYIKIIKKLDMLLAISDKSKIEEFINKNNIKKNIYNISTYYDDSIFRVMNINKRDNLTFIFCGRINEVKGWHLLISSFKVYLDRFGTADLVIIGDGEDKNRLVSLIERMGIKSRVILTGFLEPDQIAIWFNRSDIFLLPSEREGWPTVLLEALACGLPAVVTNVSGVTKLIKDGINGYIVKKRDDIEYSYYMNQATYLARPNEESIKISEKYRLSYLKSDLIRLFPNYFL